MEEDHEGLETQSSRRSSMTRQASSRQGSVFNHRRSPSPHASHHPSSYSPIDHQYQSTSESASTTSPFSDQRHSRRNARQSPDDVEPGAVRLDEDTLRGKKKAEQRKLPVSINGDVSGADLDERIARAEERIHMRKSSTTSRIRDHTDIISKNSQPSSRQLGSPSHAEGVSSANAGSSWSPARNSSTVRRSATISSMGEANKIGDGDGKDGRDRSGGSSGSGKRKPLPLDFRQSLSLVSRSRLHITLRAQTMPGYLRMTVRNYSTDRQVCRWNEPRLANLSGRANLTAVYAFAKVSS
jgi:hypothetical protein